MAFVPQLCAAEKKPDLSAYATKAELLDYNMKGGLITHTGAMENSIDTKLLDFTTQEALNTHTGIMENSINTKLLGYTTQEALNTHTGVMENSINTKLLDYATKRKLNSKLESYAKKTKEGDINAQNRKVVNVSDPTDGGHAVTLRYLKVTKPKPIICITAEAVGPVLANMACFSFGARGTAVDISNNGRSGVVLPTDGRIVYMTACSLNANGRAASRKDVSFGIIGDGVMGVEPALSVLIPGGAIKGYKTIAVDHTILGGAVLNFYCLDNSPYSRIAIVSVFVELNI